MLEYFISLARKKRRKIVLQKQKISFRTFVEHTATINIKERICVSISYMVKIFIKKFFLLEEKTAHTKKIYN